MQTKDDSWTLADADFRSFIESLSNGHIWTDRPGVDPAMQALVVERQLRRAARKLEALDKLYPDVRPRIAIGVAQLRFIADRLSMGEGVDTQDALIWLDAARTLIRLVEGGTADDI